VCRFIALYLNVIISVLMQVRGSFSANKSKMLNEYSLISFIVNSERLYDAFFDMETIRRDEGNRADLV
jgi:hypothetical protein